jgi:hypothetical protein
MPEIMSRLAALAFLSAAFVGANDCVRAQESQQQAAQGGEAFQQRLFGRPLGDKPIHVCFSRVYDVGHLAQHRQQNVRTMLLLVKGNLEDNAPSYALRMGVTFRRSGTHFESAGDCGAIHDADAGGSGVAHCGVDCDGGQIDVAIKDAKSVLVSIPEGARIWRAGSDDDSDQRKRFGADDKVFRLDRTALTQCLSLADDGKEKAAMRRER